MPIMPDMPVSFIVAAVAFAQAASAALTSLDPGPNIAAVTQKLSQNDNM
jgi:hypothetical protein